MLPNTGSAALTSPALQRFRLRIAGDAHLNRAAAIGAARPELRDLARQVASACPDAREAVAAFNAAAANGVEIQY